MLQSVIAQWTRVMHQYKSCSTVNIISHNTKLQKTCHHLFTFIYLFIYFTSSLFTRPTDVTLDLSKGRRRHVFLAPAQPFHIAHRFLRYYYLIRLKDQKWIRLLIFYTSVQVGGRTSARDAVSRHALCYNGRGIGNPDVLWGTHPGRCSHLNRAQLLNNACHVTLVTRTDTEVGGSHVNAVWQVKGIRICVCLCHLVRLCLCLRAHAYTLNTEGKSQRHSAKKVLHYQEEAVKTCVAVEYSAFWYYLCVYSSFLHPPPPFHH